MIYFNEFSSFKLSTEKSYKFNYLYFDILFLSNIMIYFFLKNIMIYLWVFIFVNININLLIYSLTTNIISLKKN